MSQQSNSQEKTPIINVKNRFKLLLSNYLSAKKEGKKENYRIKTVKPIDFNNIELSTLEEYYILFKSKSGIYRDQYHIMEMKTAYGSNEKYYYPFSAPKLSFLSNVYHTNISKDGSICLNILKEPQEWSDLNDYNSVIFSILLLFHEPNNSSPFNAAACKDYQECEKKFKAIMETVTKVSFKDKERIFNDCFSQFKLNADAINEKTDFSKYFKYFPELNDIEDIDDDNEIKLLEPIVESFKPKKSEVKSEEEVKKIEEDKKKSRHAKFSKSEKK